MMCESVLALARLARQHAAMALDATFNEHERDWSTIQAEWAFVGESCLFASGALGQMRPVLAGRVVHGERMRRNLDLTGGLMLSEAVMMRLAPIMGRGRAHELVHDLAMRAVEENTAFSTLLAGEASIAKAIPPAELAALLDPTRYTGLAETLVDRALAAVG
jgi:3-carboxy-cis,cis-muconate cycloisomerase